MLGPMPEQRFIDRSLKAERIMLSDSAWVDITRGWLVEAQEVYRCVRDGASWRSSRLFRYDHFVEENRLGAWWRRGQPLVHPALAEATSVLQQRYRVIFNSVGMMLYRDGRDGQAFHRDTDMRWLDDTIVAILTLGASRPWLLRPWSSEHDHSQHRGAIHDLHPGQGDLIVMGGRCQADWQHSVPYLGDRPCEPRISIQWRHARRTGEPYRGSSYRAPQFYGVPRRAGPPR